MQSFNDNWIIIIPIKAFPRYNLSVPSAHKSVRIAKIMILILKGIIKKFPMRVATMSR